MVNWVLLAVCLLQKGKYNNGPLTTSVAICTHSVCSGCVGKIHAGIYSVRPSPKVVSVCPGEQLTLTCIANQSSILRWTIILHGGNVTYSRSIPFMGNSILLPISDAVMFNFTRTSESGTLPLITELLIGRVNTNIHGTRIHCSPSNESDPQVTFSINVLGGM